MGKSELEALLSMLDHWAAFFILLVVVGVGGEFVTHILSSRANRRLIALQHEEDQQRQAEIARLNKDAGDARKSAGDAIERAARAQERAAEASKKAEEERAGRLKIEAQLAPRRISGEQQKIIQANLIGLSNAQITLFVITGNPEVSDFASDIERVFKAAGLTVQVNHGITFGGQERGLALTVGIHRVHDAEIVATALRAAGVTRDAIPATQADAQTGQDLLNLTILPK